MDQNNHEPSITVEDFMNEGTYFKDVCSMLDDYHKEEYIMLGEWLAEEKHILKQEFLYLKRYHHGGGIAAYAFLQKLILDKPSLMVGQFKEAVKEKCNNRLDVSQYFKDYSIIDNTKMSELTTTKLMSVGNILGLKITGLKDWESVAPHYGYTYSERKAFKRVNVIPGEFSPTEALFEFILIQKKDLHMSIIKTGLKGGDQNKSGLSRNDVVKKIEAAEIAIRRQQNCGTKGVVAGSTTETPQGTEGPALNSDEGIDVTDAPPLPSVPNTEPTNDEILTQKFYKLFDRNPSNTNSGNNDGDGIASAVAVTENGIASTVAVAANVSPQQNDKDEEASSATFTQDSNELDNTDYISSYKQQQAENRQAEDNTVPS